MNVEAIQGLGVHDEVAPLASALPGAGAAQGCLLYTSDAADEL